MRSADRRRRLFSVVRPHCQRLWRAKLELHHLLISPQSQQYWHRGNMIGVFFSEELLPDLGEKRFVQLYLSSVVVEDSSGSSSASLVPWQSWGLRSVFGLITCFGLMYAEQDIYLMMVLRMKAKILMYISLGIAAFDLFFWNSSTN